MKCRECGSDSKVVDTQESKFHRIRRRRECLNCGERFTTRECYDDNIPRKVTVELEIDDISNYWRDKIIKEIQDSEVKNERSSDRNE